MTAEQSFRIAALLEPTIGKAKAEQFTKDIEEVVEMKGTTLETKIDKLDTKIDRLETKIERLDNRMWAMLITLAVMILGLYGTIIFYKH
jgi:chromosome segregation ATPase